MPDRSVIDLYFQDLPWPVRMPEKDYYESGLGDFLKSWPHAPQPLDAAAEPIVEIKRLRDSVYDLKSPWLNDEGACHTPATLAGNLAVDLAQAFLLANPAYLGLHCSAVEFQNKLVVFLGDNRAGKSLLAARLYLDGIKLFADDLLAFDGRGEGRSFGIPPRLRALPSSLSPQLAGRFNSLTTIKDDRYLYLAAGSALAGYGEKSPLAAVVTLKRRPGRIGRASLVLQTPSQGLLKLLNRNLVIGNSALETVTRSGRIMAGRPFWALTYDDLDQAAEVLSHFFQRPEGPGFAGPEVKIRKPRVPKGGKDAAEAALAPVATRPPRSAGEPGPDGRTPVRYVRGAGTEQAETAGQFFVIRQDGQSIFHLNQTAKIIWELLEDPLSEDQAADFLARIFPNKPRSLIVRQVGRLLKQLAGQDLIAEHRENSPCPDSSI